MRRGSTGAPSGVTLGRDGDRGEEAAPGYRPPTHEVTELLRAWREGDEEAFDQVVPLVYDELKERARRCLSREPDGHTLQPTALVHELYCRFAATAPSVQWADRAHFFAVAARAMRQILVDHARHRARLKRGGGEVKLSLDDVAEVAVERPEVLLTLHEALDSLAEIDPFKASLVELRIFGGLTVKQAGVVVGCSTATVSRHWRSARAWLHRELARNVPA